VTLHILAMLCGMPVYDNEYSTVHCSHLLPYNWSNDTDYTVLYSVFLCYNGIILNALKHTVQWCYIITQDRPNTLTQYSVTP